LRTSPARIAPGWRRGAARQGTLKPSQDTERPQDCVLSQSRRDVAYPLQQQPQALTCRQAPPGALCRDCDFERRDVFEPRLNRSGGRLLLVSHPSRDLEVRSRTFAGRGAGIAARIRRIERPPRAEIRIDWREPNRVEIGGDWRRPPIRRPVRERRNGDVTRSHGYISRDVRLSSSICF